MSEREEFEKLNERPRNVVWAGRYYVPAKAYSDTHECFVYQKMFEAHCNAKESICKQVEELQARIAMQDEALKTVVDDIGKVRKDTMSCGHGWPCDCSKRNALRAISATSEDVAAWQEKQLAPLRREVAMLAALVNKAAKHVRPTCTELYTELMEGRMLTTATAEAYEREVAAKARAECKAELLESVSVLFRPHIEGVFAVLDERAKRTAELRGETK